MLVSPGNQCTLAVVKVRHVGGRASQVPAAAVPAAPAPCCWELYSPTPAGAAATAPVLIALLGPAVQAEVETEGVAARAGAGRLPKGVVQVTHRSVSRRPAMAV